MSNLTLQPNKWNDAINQVETNEDIVGGADGNANLAIKQLAENILWLKTNMQAYKVGDIYVTTLNHASATAVATHHGYGKWVRHAEGKVIVGLSTKTADPAWTKAIGNTEGEYQHTLTVAELPSISPKAMISRYTKVAHDDSTEPDRTLDIDGTATEGYIESFGGGQAHDIVQPSVVDAYWLRIE